MAKVIVSDSILCKKCQTNRRKNDSGVTIIMRCTRAKCDDCGKRQASMALVELVTVQV